MEYNPIEHKKLCDEITSKMDRDNLLEGLWTTFKATQGIDTDILRQSILDRLAKLDNVDWVKPTA